MKILVAIAKPLRYCVDMKTNYETNGTATYTFSDKIHGGTYTLCTFGAKTTPTLSKHENIWGGRTVDRMTAAGILRAARAKR